MDPLVFFVRVQKKKEGNRTGSGAGLASATRDAAAMSRAIAGLLQTAIRSRVSYTKPPASTLLRSARPKHRLERAATATLTLGVARSHTQNAL